MSLKQSVKIPANCCQSLPISANCRGRKWQSSWQKLAGPRKPLKTNKNSML
jgi:hypothetical protein